MAIHGKHHILRFEVAVDEIVVVHVAERQRNLCDVKSSIGLGESLPLHERKEVLACHMDGRDRRARS